MDHQKFEQFKRVLMFGYENKHSSFYLDKYKRENFDPKNTSAELRESLPPLLTRSELSGTPLWERMFLPLEEILLCGYTSGTTSRELFPLLRNYYIAEPPDIEASKILLLSMQYWRVVVQTEWFKRKGIFVTCGDIHNLPVTAELAANVAVDSIYSTPTVALLLAPQIEQRYDPQKIKNLLLYGEQLSDTRRESIQAVYPNAEIKTHYAFSEVGPAGFSCSNNPSVFHQDNNFYYEVIDPESENLLNPGEEGELIITTLQKIPTPLIRYKTGDYGRISEKPCTCGLKINTFSVKGRINFDTVKVGGLELKTEAFESGARELANLIYLDMYKVHVYEKPSQTDNTKICPKLVFEMFPRVNLDETQKKFIMDVVVNSTKIGPKISISDAQKKGIISYSFIFGEVGNEKVDALSKKQGTLVSHL